MKGNMWIALAVALLTAVPGGVLASHLVAGNPETVVTGHTVLASNIFVVRDRPTDFAAIAGLAFVARRNECVVWFNGIVIFDGTATNGGGPGPDNVADPCGKIVNDFLIFAVEAGDCDPRTADSSVFVRDLSFTDPNGQNHSVSEQRYTCFFESFLSANLGIGLDDPGSSDEDPLLSDGQNDNILNLVLNQTFEEYVWVTDNHTVIVDPTIDDGVCLTEVFDPDLSGLLGANPGVPDPLGLFDEDGASAGFQDFCSYNFALIVDTCNANPTDGDNARSASNPRTLCTDGGGTELTGADRGARFDDSSRSLVIHAACPATYDDIRDGNSADVPGACDPDNHREDKTAELGSGNNTTVTETDYDLEEDHLSAQVDLYVSLENCDAPVTQVGIVFCAAVLTPQLVNHPGCTSVPPDDAEQGDECWDPYQPPNDAAGVGGRDLVEGAFPPV